MKRKVKAKSVIVALFLLFSLLFLVYTCDRASSIRRERAVLPLVYAAAAEFDVPPAMILAVIRAESDFQADVTSRAGAKGLMQLMPQTFDWLCAEHFQGDGNIQSITDPATNIRFGTFYLSYLYKRFGNWRVALAAYNAGEGRVAEWLADPTLSRGGTLRRIPYHETAEYVKKALDFYVEYLKSHPG